MKRLTLLVVTLLITGCGDPIGSACQIAGSGFTAKHNCRHKCLQYREIVCPDGQRIRSASCSGKPDCTPGSCASGQLCYHIQDPFERESYCVAGDICGQYPASALQQWERQSQSSAEQLRRERAPRNTTATPAADQ